MGEMNWHPDAGQVKPGRATQGKADFMAIIRGKQPALANASPGDVDMGGMRFPGCSGPGPQTDGQVRFPMGKGA